VDGMALCQTAYAEVKDISLEEHLDMLIRRAAAELREKESFRLLKSAFSQPVYHRVDPTGVLILVDMSHGDPQQRFWQLSVLFLPKLVIKDPRIVNELFADGEDCTLDFALVHALEPMLEQYTGPGTVTLDGRDGFFFVAMRLEIRGEENEVLNSADVAEGLVDLFRNGKFDRRYGQTVRRIASVHTHVRRNSYGRGRPRKD
jgi:hypothetical protein